MGESAYKKVSNSRKELVEQIIENLENGYFFSEKTWQSNLLQPINPFTKVEYKAGNKLRLINMVIKNEYKDSRWFTFKQAGANGIKIKSGEKGTLCEKWIFSTEKETKNEYGKKEKEIIYYDKPIVNYFYLFNGEQAENLDRYVEIFNQKNEPSKEINKLIQSSECPIINVAQDRAYYSPSKDKIVLPLKESFLSNEVYRDTLIHEISHSTGHKSRLNRNQSGAFGSKEYAREELIAEMSTIFIKNELGINNQSISENNLGYIQSWIAILEKDYNELFRICSDCEKVQDRIINNYKNTIAYDIDKIISKQTNIVKNNEISIRR